MPTDGFAILPSTSAICIETGTNVFLFLGLVLSYHPDSALSCSTFLPLFSNVFYLCYPPSLHFTFLFHTSVGFFLKFWRVLRKTLSNPKEIEVYKLIHPISWANVAKLSIYLETDAVVQTLPGAKSLIENILDLIKI